jgi:hypothetical protein
MTTLEELTGVVRNTNKAISPKPPSIPVPSGSPAVVNNPAYPPVSNWQPPPEWNLSDPGIFEKFASTIGGLMGLQDPTSQAWNQVSGTFTSPTWGQEYIKNLIPLITGDLPGNRATLDAMTTMQEPGAANAYWQDTAEAISMPTYGEQYFGGTQGELAKPSFNQQFFAPAASQLSGPGQMQNYWSQMQGQQLPAFDRADSNLETQAYNQFRSSMPQFNTDAGLQPYYDRAKQRAMEDITQQTSALGAYGSSAGQGLMSQALTDLSAEQANREADYRLRQLQEQRGWEGLGGQLAGQGGAAQRGWGQLGLGQQELGGRMAGMASQEQLDRVGMGSDLANRASAERLSQIGMGGDLARTADQALLSRYGLGGQFSQAAGAEDISRLLGIGNLGSKADQTSLAQLLGAANLAQGATQTDINQALAAITGASTVSGQGFDKISTIGNILQGGQSAEENRINNILGNLLGTGGALGGMSQGTYGNMTSQDLAMTEAIYNLLLGQTGTALQGGRYQTGQARGGLQDIMSVIGDIKEWSL